MSKREALKQALIKQRLNKAAAERALINSRIPRFEILDDIPLSSAQKRIWLMQQLEPNLPFANRPLGIHLRGPLDRKILSQSISTIVDRHEALRTIFPIKNGEPIQQILPPWSLVPEIVSLQHLPDQEREAEARKLAMVAARKTFDLAVGPLIRTMLLELSESEHILFLLMHHIVFDGWSEGLLLSELRHLYDGMAKPSQRETLTNQKSQIPELPIQYKDFSLWQQQCLSSTALVKQLSYWRQHLGTHSSALELLTDYPRSGTRTFRAGSESLILPQSLTQSLKQLSQEAGVTLFMTLLATFQILLHRYTGQEKIAVGVPVAGRNRLETESLLGVFMNTLVLQTDFSTFNTFWTLLDQVRQISLEAYSHQDLPFEKLVEVLQPERIANRWPLFQVMFNFRNIPNAGNPTSSPLQITPFKFDWGNIGGLDLSLEIKESHEALHCHLSYPTDLFQANTVKHLIEHFKILLEGIVSNPDTSISTLPLMTSDEQHLVLFEWNKTHIIYSEPLCVHKLVEAQVKRTPDAVAAVFENEQLTYHQLNCAANQLARYLQQQGIGPDMPIGICVERSLDMVVGLLAILKAGSPYVPLDPEYPQERLNFMMQDSNIFMLLTQSHLKEFLSENQASVICLDQDYPLWTKTDTTNLDTTVTLDNLAYIMYTSGTTGQPKGVMIPHGAACSHLHWRHSYFPLTSSDRVLQKASLNFDDSFWEIFEPLTAGAQLVIMLPGKHRDIRYLVQTVIQQQITTLCLVPSLLHLFLEETDIEKCTTLKRVTTGGEALSGKLQRRFFQRLNAELYNGYGPTEATVAVTFWQCQRWDNRLAVPIGKPISNTQVYLLDAQLQPVPIGVAGEIYIGGSTLAQGYLNRPELTAERFIENPFTSLGIKSSRLYKTGDRARYLKNGSLEFMGRLDNQVKIRGIRIELDEIIAVLHQHPEVQQAVVIAREDEPGDKRLVAYVITATAINTEDLHSYLRNRLPNYMAPSVFVFLKALPLMPNGKVNQQALPIPSISSRRVSTEFIAPRTSVEKKLSQIWCAVLEVEQVGIYDNFFELGGHSLFATQVTSRVRDTFGIELPLRTLFESPTIAGLSAELNRREYAVAQASIQKRPRDRHFRHDSW